MDRITEGGATRPVEERLKQLFLAGLDGDAVSYRSFLAALTGHLRAFLRKRLYQFPDDVEDVVQEALLAVHNARHTYDASQPLTAWLHAVAKYKLIDYFRSRSRNEALNEPLDDYADFFGISDEQSTDARRDIGKLLETLPDKQRLPIVHVKLQGLSVAESAELTGLSESAVKVGIHRGLKALSLKFKAFL